MFCLSCGREIPDISRYCLYCGVKVPEKVIESEPPAAPPDAAPAAKTPDWVEPLVKEFPPDMEWTIRGLAAAGWSEQMLRKWLASLREGN